MRMIALYASAMISYFSCCSYDMIVLLMVFLYFSTESSFLIVLISKSARFSWIPGSEPIHLDLEKLFLLSDSMEHLKLNGQFEISDPEKIR